MVWLLLEERGAAARRIPLNNTKKAPPGDEKKEKINGSCVSLPLSSIKRKGLQKKVARTLSIESSGREGEREIRVPLGWKSSLEKKSSPWRTPPTTTRERTRWEETDRRVLWSGIHRRVHAKWVSHPESMECGGQCGINAIIKDTVSPQPFDEADSRHTGPVAMASPWRQTAHAQYRRGPAKFARAGSAHARSAGQCLAPK